MNKDKISKPMYTISWKAECNGDDIVTCIIPLSNNPLTSEANLLLAKKYIEKKWFGDDREIYIISITPLPLNKKEK